MKICGNIHEILIRRNFCETLGKVYLEQHRYYVVTHHGSDFAQREVDHVYFLEERKSKKWKFSREFRKTVVT